MIKVLPSAIPPLIALLLLMAFSGSALAEQPRQDLEYAAWTDSIAGMEGTYYYYRGLDYGTQLLIHPLRLIINGGYGIMQISNRHNQPYKINYAVGAVNVTKNLLNPLWSISEQGVWEFFSSQVIPVSIDSGKAQYWPNYMNHLIGGGMSYRMMEEWYRYHDWSHPKAWAGLTLFSYHFLNEIVENNDYRGPTPDPVADFWIFNPAGILLFSNETIARFFSKTLHLADWSYQPVYLPESRELQNNGQNFAVKFHLNEKGSRSIFYHWGTQAELGLSFTRQDGRCFSFGLGWVAKNLLDVDEISKTVDLAASAGLFYDRNNSLLASLLFARSKDYRYRLNLYPGLFDVAGLKPGFFAGVNSNERLMVGLTIGTLRNVPVGIGGSIYDE